MPSAQRGHWLRTSSLALLTMLCLSGSALAMRPFDGTDADVAGPGELAIEAGAGRLRDGPGHSLSVPEVVATLGLPGDYEVAVEGRLVRQLADTMARHRMSLDDTALMVKHLFRRGSLQDGAGPSIAAECGVLLPEVHADSGSGLTCTGVVSHRWDALVAHANGGLVRTREHTTTSWFSLIAEGSPGAPVRPVAELLSERDTSGAWGHSALVGAVWHKSAGLSFDVAVRAGRTSEGRLNELRVGVTWSPPMRQ
jgi:hypothetical protein